MIARSAREGNSRRRRRRRRWIMYLRDLLLYSRARSIIISLSLFFPRSSLSLYLTKHERHRNQLVPWHREIARTNMIILKSKKARSFRSLPACVPPGLSRLAERTRRGKRIDQGVRKFGGDARLKADGDKKWKGQVEKQGHRIPLR